MADPLSPLSPSNANRNPHHTLERNNPFGSPAKRAYRSQDHENQAFDPQLPSSPFIEDPSPVKVQATLKSPSRSPKKEMANFSPRRLTEDALRENEGLTKAMDDAAIDPSLGRKSPQKDHIQEDDSTVGGNQGFAGMDDTCFSAFSAVPNADMTRFANMGKSSLLNSQPPLHYGYRTFESCCRSAGTALGWVVVSEPSPYGRSPEKLSRSPERPTPRPASRNTPSRSRKQYDDDEDYASPTPRRHKSNREHGDTTNLLVDFTDQFTAVTHQSNRSPTRHGQPSPHRIGKFPTQPDLSTYNSSRRTPSPSKYPLLPGTPSEARHLANLLDFDLPPAPTPRSIPSISARELESMKSAFLSQISSLTATLSGKQAEVQSLKDAVTDAERRAGEAQEQIRDERSAKESLVQEKEKWEKRQGEMQTVLKDVKEEIIRGEREKDGLLQQIHEADHRREESEARIVEIESELEALRAAGNSILAGKTGEASTGNNHSSEVEAAVTKVAKELHGLYKSKHETKVTALKKSYSDRWEKKVKDLNARIEELTKENEDMRLGRDATMSSVVPSALDAKKALAHREEEEKEHRAALEQRQQQQKRDFDASLSTLQTELSTIQQTLASTNTENAHLKTELAACRVEIADLIEASEELMTLSSSAAAASASVAGGRLSRPASAEPPPPLVHGQSEGLQKSFSRSASGSASGLQRPGFSGTGESRIGRMGGAYGGVAMQRERSGSGLGRSGILSNIERMGRGREG